MQLSAPAPSVYSGRLTGPYDGRRKDGANVSAVVIPLLVRDLTGEDLPSCAWSGSALHLVHPALQSCGIGTIFIHAAEQRILARGLHRAELGVEESNPRARALYDRLGYVAYGRAPDSWDEQAPDGTITRYETMCTHMRKDLPKPPGAQ